MSPIFLPRAEPLPAVGLAALDDGVRALARRLLRETDEALAKLRGVSGPGAAVVLGAVDALPWFDGAIYLGGSGALLWPTWAEPAMHPRLLERALRRELHLTDAGALAVLTASLTGVAGSRVVSLAEARPLARAKLTALAEAA